MTLLSVRERAVSSGPLAGADPLAGCFAAFVLGTVVALSDDALTPAVALLLTLAALAAVGMPLRLLAHRGWPLLLSAAGVGLTALLLAPIDPLGSAEAAVVRVLAVALPGVAVLLAVDPTDLADSLVTRARVSPKVAYGVLAALRLLPLLAADWRTLSLARRARGLDAGRNPVAAVRMFAGQVMALLVAAVRRGTRLATAMEARGFDPAAPRTVARPRTPSRTDLVVAASGPALAAAAVAVSAAAGSLLWVWD